MAPSFGNHYIEDLLKPFSGKYSGKPLIVEDDMLVRAVEEDMPDEEIFRLNLLTASGEKFCVTCYTPPGTESELRHISTTGLDLKNLIALSEMVPGQVSLLGIRLAYNRDGFYELIRAKTPSGEIDFSGCVLETLQAYALNHPNK